MNVTITDADVVTTSTLTTHPGFGIFSFSLFVVYDEYGTRTDERFSLAKTATIQNGATPTATPTPTPTPTPTTPTPTPTPVPGEVSFTWDAVPDRYDFRRYLCRRVKGSTGTADPTAGTNVPITSGSVRTTNELSDNPGGGTFTYSLFVVYDEYGSTTDERFSLAKMVTIANDPTPTPTVTPTVTPTPTPTPSPTP